MPPSQIHSKFVNGILGPSPRTFSDSVPVRPYSAAIAFGSSDTFSAPPTHPTEILTSWARDPVRVRNDLGSSTLGLGMSLSVASSSAGWSPSLLKSSGRGSPMGSPVQMRELVGHQGVGESLPHAAVRRSKLTLLPCYARIPPTTPFPGKGGWPGCGPENRHAAQVQ